MPDQITDTPPAHVEAEIENLSTALDGVVPAKHGGNLLIGTWNIRALDRMTPHGRCCWLCRHSRLGEPRFRAADASRDSRDFLRLLE
jgi:hypothetical protein